MSKHYSAYNYVSTSEIDTSLRNHMPTPIVAEMETVTGPLPQDAIDLLQSDEKSIVIPDNGDVASSIFFFLLLGKKEDFVDVLRKMEEEFIDAGDVGPESYQTVYANKYGPMLLCDLLNTPDSPATDARSSTSPQNKTDE